MEMLKGVRSVYLSGNKAREAVLTDVSESSTDDLVTDGMLVMTWRGKRLQRVCRPG